MKQLFKSLVKISALSTLAVIPGLLATGFALADTATDNTKGTDASYIGIGFAAGLTSGGQGGDDATFGGNITGRVKLGSLPASIRGNVLWSDQTSAIIPEVSLDLPIAKKTNAFVTGGYSFVEKPGYSTPLGNRDSVVVGAGVESEVANNFLVYTNAKLGIHAYEDSDASAFSLNGGIGYRFR
jgi:hypothetical protein